MKKQTGFTLIELLVVIAIIGILATLAVISLNGARQKARDAKRVSDIRQIMAALELYNNDMGGYPSSLSFDLVASSGATGPCLSTYTSFCAISASAAAGSLFSTTSNATTTYLATMPTPPTPADNQATSGTNFCNSSLGQGSYYSYQSNLGTGATSTSPANSAIIVWPSYTIQWCLGAPTGNLSAGMHYSIPGAFN